jgi:flagellar basal body rod protein FlgB
LSVSAPATGGTIKENTEMSAQRNGNNVQLDRELMAVARAMGDFSAAQTVLAAKFRLVRYAINDGR